MKIGYLIALLLLAMPIVLAYDFGSGPSAADQAAFDQMLVPVMTVYNLAKYIASAIAGIVLLLAGINYISSGEDPKKRENAKNMAMYVIIGLVVIWAAPIIVNLLV